MELDITYTLVMFEAILVLVADAIASGLLLRAYFVNRRRSVLAFSLAWIFDLIFVAGSLIPENTYVMLVSLLALPMFSGLMFYGSVVFLREESLSISHRSLERLLLMPVVFMVYIELTYVYTGDPEWTSLVATSLGIS